MDASLFEINKKNMEEKRLLDVRYVIQHNTLLNCSTFCSDNKCFDFKGCKNSRVAPDIRPAGYPAGYPVSGKIIGRISGIRQNYWPDIRPNQYPVQP